jgi:putative SOS response-associated peptidase YedK
MGGYKAEKITNLVCTIRRAPGFRVRGFFAFLTTEPNAVVKPIHPKAMPVILTSRAECDIWLTARAEDALTLQRPLPDATLQIVARGEKEDPHRE